MGKIYTFLADGFETVEALAVVDILRRAKHDVVTVAVSDKQDILSAQNIVVKADEMLADKLYDDADILFLPGGMPGTINLEADDRVVTAIRRQYEAGKWVAAICAAPSIFGHMGILEGRSATCYPGFEKDLTGANCVSDKVVVDGNVITSKGMGTAIDLGLVMVEKLSGAELSESIASGIQYR